MAPHTTGSQSTIQKLIDVQVARLKLHISHVQSRSKKQNQQSSDGSNDCEDVGSIHIQELARWTLLSLEAHGGCTNAKVHRTWKHDGALIWLGQIVAGSARPWQDLSP